MNQNHEFRKLNFPIPEDSILLARVEKPDVGPSVCTIRNGRVFDITSADTPTTRDVCELDDPAGYLRAASGDLLGSVEAIASNSFEEHRRAEHPWFLAPCDLQVIKACGVTFAGSMIERIIEERAAGNPELAQEIRKRIGTRVGAQLIDIEPGSPRAEAAKQALIEENLWSQYLEVGIGPYAEVFTKAPVLSSVGSGARIGIHPDSQWNNPEPELVLVVNSCGTTVGATLGNDVNLRDFEGRSALLLSKAKDNNASCAIGPFIRMLDDNLTLDTLRKLTIHTTIVGDDGFLLEEESRMAEISRDPDDLVRQALNENHAYPDGMLLFCGTPFAPTKDRDAPGAGFTHHVGDTVFIEAKELGRLRNTVAHCADCSRWNFSASHLMRNLASRGLI